MPKLDWHYLYAAIAFAVGLLTGFQAIYNRYPTEPLSSTFTLPGMSYLTSRGALPALVFVVLYYQHVIQGNFFLYSLGIGTGAELFLRTQILIKQTPKPGGGLDDLVKGPLDLLRWYQDLFLISIETKRAATRQKFVRDNIPQLDFKELCNRVLDNVENFYNEAFKEKKLELETSVKKLKEAFDADTSEPDPARKNERFCRKLGYVVLRTVGEANFKTLFALNP
jgi:hypothetical protein